MKVNSTLKVAIGYVFLILVIFLASWLVYGNMTSLIKVSQEEQRLLQHRSIADSLICNLMDINNKGQSIMLGLDDDIAEFDSTTMSAISLADKLKVLVVDSIEKLRIDSLKDLLIQKGENMLLISESLKKNNQGKYLQNKLRDLNQGKDSVVIHQQIEEKTKNSETVYEVVKTKKGFFSRLGDAFRRQHIDTIVRQDSSKMQIDTVMHNIDIADSVAVVLTDIKTQEDKLKKEGLASLSSREKDLQIVSIDIAERIGQLLDDIRKEEQDSFKIALQSDLSSRKEIMKKIFSLAIISLLMAAILLVYFWRDSRRERKYRENLEAAKKETEKIMQQRERLLLTITHDIKAPIASISGFTELISMQKIDSKAASYLESIKKSSTHLLHLVSELLDYHRLNDGKMEIIEVSFSIKKLVIACKEEMLHLATSKGISLIVNLDEAGDRMLRGDALRISQILENLLSNAIKYTSKGRVTITAKVKNKMLHLSVADTGQGMNHEESQKIFEAFTRLKSAQGIEGVGLGLSITKELVELLSGTITLKTQKDKGSEFNVVIPIEVSKVKEPEDNQRKESSKSSYRLDIKEEKQILVIDDDELQLKLLLEMLYELTQGLWNVTSCQDVYKGLDIINSKHFDILITDIEMPAMSGKELIGKIKKEDIKIIGMTAHEPDILPSLEASGFSSCLFKPFTIYELAKTLSKVTSIELIKIKDNQQSLLVSNRFSKLTIFASGDVNAEKEILSCFLKDLQSNVKTLSEALLPLNRDKISHVAHKAFPSMSMVEFNSLELLKGLLPKNIDKKDDKVILQDVDVIIKEIKDLILELSNILK